MSQRVEEDKSLTEQLTEGSEHSLGKKIPGGPFVVVGLSYMVVLIFCMLTIALVMWWMR